MSQKYIVGESYGTTRAVGLAEYLHTTHGIDLNGIVLISPVLDFNTILINSSNNLPYILFFPTYSEIALYHHKISFDKSIEEVRREVEDWAMDEYMPGIARGNTLSADRKNSIVDTIAGYTGLSKDYILKNDLKIPVNRFQKELLRDQNKVVGRMDARFTGPDKDPAGEGSGYDPSLEMLVGTFASSVNHYVRNDLDFKSDTPYKYLNYSISREWNWQSGINNSQGYVNVSQALTDALHINQYLNVFVASGYYDLATPYFAIQYTVNQLKLEKSLRDNISIHFYNAGHMMYTNRPSLIKLTEDISLFFKKR
jgi:carboxypeptidase C (cathepsin A)